MITVRGRISMAMDAGGIQPKTPGIHVTYYKSGGGSQYPSIIHTKSGAVLKAMRDCPLQISKRDFIAKIDNVLSGVDWTQDADALRSDPKAETKARSLGGLQRR